MRKVISFHNSNIRLLCTLASPEVAEHLSGIAKEGHPVLSGFGKLFIKGKHHFPDGYEAAFYRFFLLV